MNSVTQSQVSTVRPSGKVWEWFVESASRELVAAGYCATKTAAEADLAHWRNGGSIRCSPSFIKAIDRSI